MSAANPSPRELLDRLHELTLQDGAATHELYAEDAVHEVPFAPAGTPSRIEGRETLRQMMSAEGDAPVEFQEFADRVVYETSDPEVVIAEYHIVGRITATGQQFRFPNLLVLRARDGKIVNTRSYFNPSQFAELVSAG